MNKTEFENIVEMFDIDEEEVEVMAEAYDGNFSEDSIEDVWENVEEIAFAYITKTIPDSVMWVEDYIDYDKLGNDIVDDNYEKYYGLKDGRVVEFK